MEDKQVSVVVPVYNVRDYLKECLESIMNQTYSNLEILLVDDGSSDGSSEICDAYAKKDKRVRAIHQKNAGSAHARKSGIMEATAPLLCFVDSDDTIDKEMIQYFVEHIGEADLLASGCIREEPDGTYTKRYDSFEAGIYRSAPEMNYILSNMMMYQGTPSDGILPYAVSKLYRTHLLKDVVQDADERITYGEDRELVLRYILRCQSIVITKTIFYNYRYRSTSLAHRKHDFYLHDLSCFYNSLKPAFEAHASADSLMRQLQKFVTYRTVMAARIMGFAQEAWRIRYIFPFYNTLDGKKVVLYGAGVVGNDYYRQIIAEKNSRLVLWADKNWQKYQAMREKVEPAEQILKVAFDVIIIAVKKKTLAESIMADLKEMGISQEQMQWKAPLDILAIS